MFTCIESEVNVKFIQYLLPLLKEIVQPAITENDLGRPILRIICYVIKDGLPQWVKILVTQWGIKPQSLAI